MSQAKYTTTTHANDPVRYIEADLSTIKVESISGKNVSESGKYGINGTFFTSATNLTGIAVARTSSGSSSAVVNGGTSTTGVSYNGSVYPSKRGTMYGFSSNSVGSMPVSHYLDYPNVTPFDVLWAIGGYSLHPTKTYANQDAYYTDINGSGAATKQPTSNSENAYRLSPTSPTARTAIGYRVVNQQKKIILAVFANHSAWTVRQFMVGLGCTHAVMLDGGGSSQMRYKSGSTNGFWCPKPDAGNVIRKVHTMVTVNATQWL